MIMWMGAGLILLSCLTMGVMKSLELKRSVRSLEEAVQIAERMRSAICAWRQPLPKMLYELQNAFPRRFCQAGDTYSQVRDVPFSAYWRACLSASGLCEEAVLILYEAGAAVAQGEPPERVMDLCRFR